MIESIQHGLGYACLYRRPAVLAAKPIENIEESLMNGGRSMRIEHVALYVINIERAKIFFEKYFEAKAGELYHNKTTGFSSYFLSFSDGTRLEIMTSPAVSDDKKKMTRSGFIHIAFSLGSRENVDELTERMKNDGYTVASGPRTTGDGYYESCILDAEGNQIELTV